MLKFSKIKIPRTPTAATKLAVQFLNNFESFRDYAPFQVQCWQTVFVFEIANYFCCKTLTSKSRALQNHEKKECNNIKRKYYVDTEKNPLLLAQWRRNASRNY
jgi:hypothetical protein